ncbi:putative ribonuclease H-like domain-containing protein [Tanacetum coccineum]
MCIMTNGQKKAQCKYCFHFLSEGSNTTLKNHITHPHCEVLKAQQNQNPEAGAKRRWSRWANFHGLEFQDDGFATSGFGSKGKSVPVLSRMAMDILSVQASSVASESAFSTSGRLLTIRRTRLTPESLEMCMCLKDHLDAQERKQDTSPLENLLLRRLKKVSFMSRFIELAAWWVNFLDKKCLRECLKSSREIPKFVNHDSMAIVAISDVRALTPAVAFDVVELKRYLVLELCFLIRKTIQAPATVKAVKESCSTVSQAAVVNIQTMEYRGYRPSMVSNQVSTSGAPAPQAHGVSKADFESYVKANDASITALLLGSGSLPENTIANLEKVMWKANHTPNRSTVFAPHKILMEENAKPVVQHQRRVNPKIHEVIKQEVIKLLDAGLIYPISVVHGKLKTRWSGPFTVTQVFPYGTVELSQNSGPNFKVNGHRLKHYFGGDIPTEDFPDCEDSRARMVSLIRQRVSAVCGDYVREEGGAEWMLTWKRIFKKRTKKASKNGQNRARNGKDKVKSKPKSVKVKKSTGKSTPTKSKVNQVKKIQLEGLKLPNLKLYYKNKKTRAEIANWNGYRRGTIHKTLFLKKDKHDIILVQVYVDDIIFGSTKKSWCDEFEALMKSRFQMSSMGELTFFLRLQVKQKADGIFISQDKYVAEILNKFDFVHVKTASTPIETYKPLVKDEEASDVDVHLYRSMIGSLMYLTASRPDIMFAVCACSRFQVTPKTSHLGAVKRIFRYLKGKPKLGLWYPRVSSFDLEAYSNSDYAEANLDRKSTIGGCQFLGRRLISWQCKKQTIVATSTTEAEYVAAENCCGQVLWIQNQMLDNGFNFMNTKIYIDKECIICIVKNPVYHSKTKHNSIRHHFIRDAYEKKLIQVLKIHTDDNVADLLTKAFDVSSSIHYALTVSPVISTTFVEQFWTSAKSQTFNNVRYINAKVAGKPITISEASIQSDLHFNDVDGINSLNNHAIFDAIKLMGSKSTSWDQIPTNIATAVICLTSNQKFNFSKLILLGYASDTGCSQKMFVMYPRFISIFLSNQLTNVPVLLDHFPIHALSNKVFSFMVKKGKHFSGKVTPLFPNMLVQPTEDEGEGSERPSEPQPTPSPPHPSEAHVEPQSDPSPGPSPTIPIPDPIPEGSGGNLRSQSSNDKSLSGSEGGLTLQSVYDLYLSLCIQVTAQAAEINILKESQEVERKQGLSFFII